MASCPPAVLPERTSRLRLSETPNWKPSRLSHINYTSSSSSSFHQLYLKRRNVPAPRAEAQQEGIPTPFMDARVGLLEGARLRPPVVTKRRKGPSMADIKTLAVSDLLLMSRPVTGGFLLTGPPWNPSDPARNSVRSPGQKGKRPRSDETLESRSVNFDRPERSRVLAPLNHPVLLIGTVDLLIGVGDQRSRCSEGDCFVFTDGEARVCCDVLDLDLEMIGRRVRVLAWNFIPSKSSRGLLEIIKWEFMEILSCSSSKTTVSGFFPLYSSIGPLRIDDSLLSWSSRAGRDRVCGQLNSVTTVFDVPCTLKSGASDVNTGSRLESLKGFLAEFLVCDCSECGSEMLPSHIYNDKVTSVAVYACGSAVKWRPVLAKLVGSFMSIVGLKKKWVFIDGKPIPVLVFMSKTCIRLYRKEQDVSWGESLMKRTATKGKGFIGMYTGVVTGIFMQGMIVELDEKVWLVLTDQASSPHALRIGAIVVVRNTHFVFPNFSWGKLLLLGACVKTAIVVKRFSALATQCHFRSRTDSLLGKFIGSLSFAAKFWALVTVSSFREKFSRMLSEKEILGSKSKEGLVQIYARLCLPDHLSLDPCSIFEEFCHHGDCCMWDDPDIGITKLASPIYYISNHLESMWMSLSTHKSTKNIKKSKDASFFLHERSSYSWFERRIISSKDLGMALLGRLQICPSSGRLQLMDATGGIDVVVPDLQLHTNDDIIYMVDNYNLVVEGPPVQTLEMEPKKFDLCRNIFQHTATQRKLPLTVYVHFYIKSAAHVGYHAHLPAPVREPDNAKDHLRGKFHLLFVKHKFPLGYNVPAYQRMSNISTLYAEAILLPFSLLLPGESGAFPADEQRKEPAECSIHIHPEGHIDKHRSDTDVSNVSSISFLPKRIYSNKFSLGFGDSTGDSCPNFIFSEQYGDVCHQKFEGEIRNIGFPLDVICHFTSKSFSTSQSCFPGVLSSIGDCSNNEVSETRKGEIVMLEFSSGSFQQFQLLQIGAYYMISCHQDTGECQFDDIIQHSSCTKVLITPSTRLWSPSFSSFPHESEREPSILSASVTLEPSLAATFLIMNQVPLRCFTKNRLMHQRFKLQQMPSGLFDLNLHLHLDKLKFLRQVLRAVEDSSSYPSATYKDARRYVEGNLTRNNTSSVNQIGHLLPRGHLISVCGEVLDVHRLGRCSVNAEPFRRCGPGVRSLLSFLLGELSGICIHVNDGSQMVKIHGTLNVQTCPSGLGPGTIATFYSVLLKSRQVLLLTPATFIVINAIKEVDCRYGIKCLKSHIMEDGFGLLSTTLSSLVSSPFHRVGSNFIQIHGRVVAVCGIVFEKRHQKHTGSSYWQKTMNPTITIPLAGFIFDDGSRTCYCWATAESAETLLRLHETASEAFVTKPDHSRCGREEPLSTVVQILGKIIKKHRKIIMKNDCAASADGLSCLDFSFSSCSNNAFCSSDQHLLKFIILNACLGSTLVRLAGYVMDCDTLEGISRYMDMQIRPRPLHHFFVKEACHVDPLTEARNIFQELI